MSSNNYIQGLRFCSTVKCFQHNEAEISVITMRLCELLYKVLH
jgi:hypothetical protein